MLTKIINWFKNKPQSEKAIKRYAGYKLIKREGEGHYAVIRCPHLDRQMTSQPRFDLTEYYCGDCDSYFLEQE